MPGPIKGPPPAFSQARKGIAGADYTGQKELNTPKKGLTCARANAPKDQGLRKGESIKELNMALPGPPIALIRRILKAFVGHNCRVSDPLFST